jgi:hypothetical protein
MSEAMKWVQVLTAIAIAIAGAVVGAFVGGFLFAVAAHVVGIHNSDIPAFCVGAFLGAVLGLFAPHWTELVVGGTLGTAAGCAGSVVGTWIRNRMR